MAGAGEWVAGAGVVVADPGKAHAVPKWIWGPGQPKGGEVVCFRREVLLPEGHGAGGVTVTCDNGFRLWVNGRDLGRGSDWGTPQHYKVPAKLLRAGRNVIAVRGTNEGGAAGMALRFALKLPGGKELVLVSDEHWTVVPEAGAGWFEPEAPDQGVPARVVGIMGDQPWGDVMGGSVEQTGPIDMTARFKVAAGFRLERLYAVPKAQGSWVAMTRDDQGRLICSDQYGGIYRVTVGEEVAVEALDIPLAGGQGMLWLGGTLYVSVNSGGDVAKAGVYRVDDTDGDGDPDTPVMLKALQGGGEHGPHALVASPDGKWIYLSCGNHTDVPEMDRYLAPKLWDEDQLLPRRPDARGHARGRMAPGGWIARFHPDGTQWELVATGFRNQYDITFNDQGDLFAYDADMEWDMGLPWYRPTRVSHVVPGLESGWRNGTGKWPAYYEDSMPAMIDLGPGSPTGFLSGKGAAFPERYQRALYALDWTFGTIYALHLRQDGVSYAATSEEMVAGAGLPLTDGVIGKDGALYFTSGGRRTDSFLWRLSYTGGEGTTPVAYGSQDLELMPPGEAKAALGSPDRVVRFQARVALEAAGAEAAGQPGEFTAPWGVINRVILGARTNGEGGRAALLAALDGLDWEALDAPQKVGWLRAAGLVFMRSGAPDPAERSRVLAKIDAAFPANDAVLNAELCRMLCYLKAPGVVGRTLALMDASGPEPAPDWLDLVKRNKGYGGSIERMLADMPPAQVVHYVNCLRCVPGPWDRSERERFLVWLDRLEGEQGGNSFVGYIQDFRKEALAIATPEEREWLAKHAPAKVADPFADLPPVKGPGRTWTVDDVVALAAEGLQGRVREDGERVFRAALCSACHRFDGTGGAAGPDLTAAAGRFTVKDLAEAIVEPGKVVSDQYAFEIISKRDGTQVVGRAVDEKDEKLIVAVNPFDFTQTVEVVLSDVEATKPSPVSPMPAGMINRLNQDELKDLLAYLLGK